MLRLLLTILLTCRLRGISSLYRSSLLRAQRFILTSPTRYYGAKSSDVITPRSQDYSQWYNNILAASDMVDQSPVRGCMVIKPWGMAVWDRMRENLDKRIQRTGTSNAYFPLFIPKSFLAKEAEHVQGFAKECAVVTHHRLKVTDDGKDLIPDPDSILEEPLIVRPTSETIIWNMFSKWIQSHRDLPLKINQWANVVRWEMRTRPFLRTSEFLWQEGHTAHASSEEAQSFSRSILSLYEEFCKDVLALPVIAGVKSPSERFAGAEATYTIEALMQNGWALQAGTSHFLGQNFAKAFDVYYQTENNTRELVWATSWGVSTRLLGAMLMVHSDDRGVLLPPRVAPYQVVIVPIFSGNSEADANVERKCQEVQDWLETGCVRTKFDDRRNVRHGSKFYEWERKGVPLRLDIGPRDITAQQASVAARMVGKKSTVSLERSLLLESIVSELDKIQEEMFQIASSRLIAKTYRVDSYAEMKEMLEKDEQRGLYLVPWKEDAENEEKIKLECKATIRCYPFESNRSEQEINKLKCFYSGQPATHYAIFARAF